MQEMQQALTLMRQALNLLDETDDPFLAAPHLDLAIARIESGFCGRAPGGRGNGDGDVIQ